MINFYLSIHNPWGKDKFKSIWEYFTSLTSNKGLELQFAHYPRDLLVFQLNLEFQGSDHAGPSIEIALLGYTFNIKIYDFRHWDYETNTWVKYNEHEFERNL